MKARSDINCLECARGRRDIERIENAFNIFRKPSGRPTFIVFDSHIGYGSPHKQDTAEAHGEPLGDDE
jgi:transketolase